MSETIAALIALLFIGGLIAHAVLVPVPRHRRVPPPLSHVDNVRPSGPRPYDWQEES